MQHHLLVTVDDTHAVVQNALFTLHQIISVQAAAAFTDTHQPACGVKAQTDLLCSIDAYARAARPISAGLMRVQKGDKAV